MSLKVFYCKENVVRAELTRLLFLFTDKTSFVKEKPGIRFTEKMVGTYEASKSNAKQTPCEFTLTIDSNDVERMLKCDPSHSATISGTVTCLALSCAPLSVSEGKFKGARSR